MISDQSIARTASNTVLGSRIRIRMFLGLPDPYRSGSFPMFLGLPDPYRSGSFPFLIKVLSGLK